MANIYWYQCKKCNLLIKKDSYPRTTNCPSGGFHNWNKLGEFGFVNYQCRKCAMTLQTKSFPGTVNCSSGGFHNWVKL
ncbi:MAG: hypothetical protein IKA37_05595 [Spirochaetales bacterium]|nr:hypothetical protein [Spirochaetales bacterium]MBR2317428.1 hypothetical protein [Spirochaetales bacterium]